MNRRSFLSNIVSLFSAGTAALFSLPIVKFLTSSLSDRQTSGWYSVIDTSTLSEEVTKVSYNRIVREGWLTRAVQETVWIHRKPDGTITAYEPHCTHLGCAYAWNDQVHLFECPCHGGKFDVNGSRVDGPPPRPLDRYETRMDGKILEIGKILKA